MSILQMHPFAPPPHFLSFLHVSPPLMQEAKKLHAHIPFAPPPHFLSFLHVSPPLMQEAKKLHAHIIVKGLQTRDRPLLRKLISFFALSNPSFLYYARLIFNAIENPSTFTCNTMLRAYATSTKPIQAILLYNHMHTQALPPDNYTFPFLLKACSNLPSLPKGQETHCRLVKHGLDADIFIQNSLIHLYGSNSDIKTAHRVFNCMVQRDVASWTTLVSCYLNFDSIESARRLFDDMPARSVVSFSAMIAGYVRRGRFKEALGLFLDFQVAGMEPNDSMLMSVISACANVGALDSGRWIHSYVHKIKGGEFDRRITTALIDMYCKCGSLQDAWFVFEKANDKQVGEWTAMITGMAVHGFGERSIKLFENMVRLGIQPNVVTFVALLSACTHAGLVKEGLRYFDCMKVEYGIQPTIEHFGCVTDLLGRAGLIDEAIKIIRKMPMKANAAIWGALLTACRIHRNVEVGEIAARWLISEEPWNGAVYMSLVGLYSELGRRDDVERVKKEMKDVGSRKSPGCSMVEVDRAFHEFVAGDKSHPQAVEVCLNLGELIVQEKENTWIFS